MNYYQVLGVQKTATQDEIKSAYRNLAKLHHPDRNLNNPESTDKFQQIQTAYEILSDETKRSQYDGKSTFKEFNFQDIFNQYGNWSGDFDKNFGARQESKGADVTVRATFTIAEAYNGCSKTFDFGHDSVRVDFGKGIHNGMVLKVYGRGDYNRFNSNAQRGDLIINININPDDSLILQGSDIWVDAYLHFYDLILGANIEVEIPFGKYKIDVPAKTASGRILRIPGKGMPIYNSKNNEHGNLMVKVHANFHGLTEAQLDLVKKIKELE
jgi:curved DNA-binding protein